MSGYVVNFKHVVIKLWICSIKATFLVSNKSFKIFNVNNITSLFPNERDSISRGST